MGDEAMKCIIIVQVLRHKLLNDVFEDHGRAIVLRHTASFQTSSLIRDVVALSHFPVMASLHHRVLQAIIIKRIISRIEQWRWPNSSGGDD